MKHNLQHNFFHFHLIPTSVLAVLLVSSLYAVETEVIAAPRSKSPVMKAQSRPLRARMGDRGLKAEWCPRIGDKVPAFDAESTKGKISFPKDFTGKWIIFFSHPADFTPVCKTEFKRLATMVNELKKLNAEVVGISVDQEYVHEIWLRKIEKELSKKTERKINFPVIADPEMKVSKLYGMIHPNESKEQTVRSIYFIDPKGTLRAFFYYPIANGRNFSEVKRLLQALQITDEQDVSTPEGWEPGRKTIPHDVSKKDVFPG